MPSLPNTHPDGCAHLSGARFSVGAGFDTIASACGIARHLPIVVLTGADDDEMSLRAISLRRSSVVISRFPKAPRYSFASKR